MIDETYMKKENRDKRYKELKEWGYDARKYSEKGDYLILRDIMDFPAYPNKKYEDIKGFRPRDGGYVPILYGVRAKETQEKKKEAERGKTRGIVAPKAKPRTTKKKNLKRN